MFRAIFEISTRCAGISAQEIMDFGSYKMAWSWLHKLRATMVRTDREPLGPFVQVWTGRISKCGDPILRSYLYEAAGVLLTCVQKWSALKAWGTRLAKRIGMRKPELLSRANSLSSCIGCGSTAPTDAYRRQSAFDVDPPTSSQPIMRRAQSPIAERTMNGKDSRGELDTPARNWRTASVKAYSS